MADGDFDATILTADPTGATASDELDASGFSSTSSLVDDGPPTTGQGPIFDWDIGDFSAAGVSTPPLSTGIPVIVEWAQKCLATDRGGADIHPLGYGLEGRSEFFGQSIDDIDVTLLSDRITTALTFHPRIVDVEDLTVTVDPDQDIAVLDFAIVLDTSERTDITTAIGAGPNG